MLDLSAIRMSFALAIAALASIASAVRAEPPVPREGCYVRDYAKGADPENYSRIRIAITIAAPDADAEAEKPLGDTADEEAFAKVRIKYAYWPLPDAEFGYDEMSCRRQGTTIRCSVECDGGGIALRPLVNGDVLLESGTQMRVEEAAVSSILLNAREADGFAFRGTHVLRPVPAEQCASQDQRVSDRGAAFKPGDYHPMVKTVNGQLAKLGFLSAPPNPLYTQDTAAAMRAFQTTMGLPVSGMADPRSIKLLNIRAVTSGGC